MSNYRKVEVGINVHASKALLWDLLFTKFGQINMFHPGLEGSHHTVGEVGQIGCERQCDLDGKTSVREKIISAKLEESFVIDVTKGLPGIPEMKAEFSLYDIGEGNTKVKLQAKFKTNPSFLGFLMLGMMKKRLFQVLIGLKYYSETGLQVNKTNAKEVFKLYKKLQSYNQYQFAS